jgi:integrase
MPATRPIIDQGKVDALKAPLRGGARAPRDGEPLLLGTDTALRIGDILALVFSDVSAAPPAVREGLAVTERKTGKARRFCLNPAVRKALRERIGAVGPEDWDGPLYPAQASPLPWLAPRPRCRLRGGRGRRRRRLGIHWMRKTFARMVWDMTRNLPLLMHVQNRSSQDDTFRHIGLKEDGICDAYLNLAPRQPGGTQEKVAARD